MIIDNELNQELVKEFEKIDIRIRKNIILVSLILILVFGGVFLLRPTLTGYITLEKQYNYTGQ